MRKVDLTALAGVLACPNCEEPLSPPASDEAACGRCGQTYRRLPNTWDFIPSAHCSRRSAEWQTWDVLQANGMLSYQNDPEHNLSTGVRADCLAFSRFCRFHGLVLDVGAGPQPLPSYFTHYSEGTLFVGVDPLAGMSEPEYILLRALGEHLPFRAESFDHVVFATSIDHFVDPCVGLREAARVCRTTGSIEIWIGEKRPGAPAAPVSPPWYQGLRRPPTAEDPFHLRRLTSLQLRAMLGKVGLAVTDEETHRIDPYRCHYFCRAQPHDRRVRTGAKQ